MTMLHSNSLKLHNSVQPLITNYTRSIFNNKKKTITKNAFVFTFFESGPMEKLSIPVGPNFGRLLL